jgi:hypothetical protein
MIEVDTPLLGNANGLYQMLKKRLGEIGKKERRKERVRRLL